MAVQKERRINYADRHWTEKPLDQMRERDWRIFKEDFNISCKGTSWVIMVDKAAVVFRHLVDLTHKVTHCSFLS
jgi:hypothetical protein